MCESLEYLPVYWNILVELLWWMELTGSVNLHIEHLRKVWSSAGHLTTTTSTSTRRRKCLKKYSQNWPSSLWFLILLVVAVTTMSVSDEECDMIWWWSWCGQVFSTWLPVSDWGECWPGLSLSPTCTCSHHHHQYNNNTRDTCLHCLHKLTHRHYNV